MTDANQNLPKKFRDDQSAGDVWFYTDVYRFYHDGLKKLLTRLKQFENAKDIFQLEEHPLEKEMRHIERMITWGEQQLADSGNTWREIAPRPSYGSLRLLKAGGMLQIREYEQKKLEYLRKNKFTPTKVIQAIEEKINQMKNMIELGAMNGLEAADVFVEVEAWDATWNVPPQKTEIHDDSHPMPTVLVESDEIPIVDEQIRSRCLYLLRSIQTEDDETKLDTVVREVSVILEDRVRTVAGITEKPTGVDLMAEAFAGTSPRLLFSDDPAIQNAAHLLFRGYVGFFRNEVMHKLVTTFSRERVYQLLGYIDYLLFLLSRAHRTKPSSGGETTNNIHQEV